MRLYDVNRPPVLETIETQEGGVADSRTGYVKWDENGVICFEHADEEGGFKVLEFIDKVRVTSRYPAIHVDGEGYVPDAFR